ncbi:MAG TPA: hypothetical protein VFL83_10895 [Anaeromyxobacter sp.]|nr:hypothetical protein [Anaeromyxobacter sp.]
MPVKLASLLALALAAGLAGAAEPKLKPFVLASRVAGDPAKVADEVRAKLEAAGFEVAGRYAPYDGAIVLAVTAPDLRSAAAQQRFGGYAAAQRVTVTKVADEVQVAFTSPAYMAAGYRLKADLGPVEASLAQALGRLEEYGPKDGKSAKDLRGYHYMMSMPYFDDPWELAKYPTQAEALAAVEAGLAAGKGKTRKVYRVDVSPDETVFGVALGDGCGADANVMKEIDFKPVRSTGHLPYEVLVSKGEVYALHAKFRIALNFTDLSMMGDHSFMRIRCAPGSIEGALKAAVAR